MNVTTAKLAVARRALLDLITAANGGTPPDRIWLDMKMPGERPNLAFDEADRRDRLVVTLGGNGRLCASAGIATHWTMLWHHDLAFARTPGDQLILLGDAVHLWIEDGRLLADTGSPLLSRAGDEDAMARFDGEFAGLMGGAK